jgi:hypothetical protein
MLSRFDEELPLMTGRGTKRGVRLSVCAMGPVAKGDKLDSMEVWVWQQHEDGVALSTGKAGEHLGGPKKSPREKLPFSAEKGWMIQTALAKGSKQFVKGKPALAMAIAMVTRKNGEKDVEHWMQGVSIRALRDSDYY